MAGLWQRTGNVTVTNGSKIVTGFGTKWKTGTLPIQKGHTFYGPDNAAYEVDTVVSDTEILLVDTYRGGTMANQPYRIDITRTSTISQFAADLASLVAKYRTWFDGMMTWLTGSGDVAILNPDTGANVTIPSWKKVASEGEGQTARAKVEADRAKTEADRALTEADRAAGIVAAAALPLPDVWAPLSDSLRLITGYGRDVLVGSDVVARMVNFSRSTTATYIGKDGLLKTAAANEPRFEKAGLLVEGQSTNLNPRSQQFNWMDGYGASPAVQSPNTDPQTSSLITTIDVTEGRRRPFIADVLTVGKTYTISFRAKSDGGAISQVASQLTGAVYPAVAPGEWKTYSFTGVAIGAAVDFQITGTSVSIAWIQVEELPFASSYIPTAGAAATRVADRAYILWENNMPLSVANAVSFAVEATPYKSTAPDSRTILDLGVASASLSIGNNNAIAYITINNKSSIIGLDPNEVTHRIVARYDGSFLTAGNKGVISTPSAYTADGNRPSTRYMRIGAWKGGDTGWETAQYGTYRCIWGHIRNIRIWHSALTNEQMRAIR
ncbi:phage head spike fiber domain-containing protein [Aeromonas caviae]|uniref:phage head spike fiber domain-containing protein n=1 Tax=Aeromonas caviae TaxID=648 RepID=UPI0039894DA8